MAKYYNQKYGDATGPQLLAEAYIGKGNDSKAIEVYGANFVKEHESRNVTSSKNN